MGVDLGEEGGWEGGEGGESCRGGSVCCGGGGSGGGGRSRSRSRGAGLGDCHLALKNDEYKKVVK